MLAGVTGSGTYCGKPNSVKVLYVGGRFIVASTTSLDLTVERRGSLAQLPYNARLTQSVVNVQIVKNIGPSMHLRILREA